MNKYHIRFNTQHGESDLVWRIFENDKEYLVKSFKITCTTFDEITIENDVKKWNLCCYGNMTIHEDVATIR